MVGEAPGKDGARWTGVPFTSCRLLTGSGPAERTATAVHRALADLDCDDQVLLWNVSALFPPDNRTPRKAEIDACAQVLDLVCRGRTVFAIGRCAQRATERRTSDTPPTEGHLCLRQGYESRSGRRRAPTFAMRSTGWPLPVEPGRCHPPGRVARASVTARRNHSLTTMTGEVPITNR